MFKTLLFVTSFFLSAFCLNAADIVIVQKQVDIADESVKKIDEKISKQPTKTYTDKKKLKELKEERVRYLENKLKATRDIIMNLKNQSSKLNEQIKNGKGDTAQLEKALNEITQKNTDWDTELEKTIKAISDAKDNMKPKPPPPAGVAAKK